jgi:hypothetical protein
VRLNNPPCSFFSSTLTSAFTLFFCGLAVYLAAWNIL